ncbi:MAG: hypothetical protein PVI33_03585, partial [Candidatus Omnitrophota bacterium]
KEIVVRNNNIPLIYLDNSFKLFTLSIEKEIEIVNAKRNKRRGVVKALIFPKGRPFLINQMKRNIRKIEE